MPMMSTRDAKKRKVNTNIYTDYLDYGDNSYRDISDESRALHLPSKLLPETLRASDDTVCDECKRTGSFNKDTCKCKVYSVKITSKEYRELISDSLKKSSQEKEAKESAQNIIDVCLNGNDANVTELNFVPHAPQFYIIALTQCVSQTKFSVYLHNPFQYKIILR